MVDEKTECSVRDQKLTETKNKSSGECLPLVVHSQVNLNLNLNLQYKHNKVNATLYEPQEQIKFSVWPLLLFIPQADSLLPPVASAMESLVHVACVTPSITGPETQ